MNGDAASSARADAWGAASRSGASGADPESREPGTSVGSVSEAQTSAGPRGQGWEGRCALLSARHTPPVTEGGQGRQWAAALSEPREGVPDAPSTRPLAG